MAAPIATCHVDTCKFNDQMNCMAPSGIKVNVMEDHADCETFTPQG